MKIEKFKRVEGNYTYIFLDIYYRSLEEYQVRKDFEKNNENWNKIWFNDANKHEEVSFEVFDIL